MRRFPRAPCAHHQLLPWGRESNASHGPPAGTTRSQPPRCDASMFGRPLRAASTMLLTSALRAAVVGRCTPPRRPRSARALTAMSVVTTRAATWLTTTAASSTTTRPTRQPPTRPVTPPSWPGKADLAPLLLCVAAPPSRPDKPSPHAPVALPLLLCRPHCQCWRACARPTREETLPGQSALTRLST